MSEIILKNKSKNIRLHKSIMSPDFEHPTVLTNDIWEYVKMFLKREGESDLLLYWDQAKSFYSASKGLPKISSPVMIYYSILNMTKTLLEYKRIRYSSHHGVSKGTSTSSSSALSNVMVRINSGGVLPSLASYLSPNSVCLNQIFNGRHIEFSIKDLLYNLPFVHRSFCLTYKSSSELYYPIEDIHFVRKSNSRESWVKFKCKSPYDNKHTLNKINSVFEIDQSSDNNFCIRSRRRFRWTKTTPKQNDFNRLKTYHETIRNHFHYISSPQRLWYVKKDSGTGVLDIHPLVIIFSVMHSLSELSRYDPVKLNKHFSNVENWLLTEFISNASYQFLDGVASEITGHEFMPPSMRGR